MWLEATSLNVQEKCIDFVLIVFTILPFSGFSPRLMANDTLVSLAT